MKNLKHLPVQFDAKAMKEDGVFEGYASTFGNVDAGYDVVMPGAFAQSLKVRPAGAVKGCTQAVVSAGLVNMKGSQRSGRSIDEPAPTVCAGTVHAAEVRAFLIKYYGSDQDPRLEEPMHTATTKARFGLVSVHGETYEIVDIGMRMLTPRELFRAQGFPDTYEIVTGQTPDGPIALNKTAQIRMCGNSVCPPMARALVAANFVPGDIGDRPAPAPMDLPLLTAAE